ncbi:sulfite exporter TauE/SafE family protein [Pokkaliibacter sp. CJK22405]|uniref:sulfite exporter TauE/SafE family protein n=1 Tax=Pokkaliibacter sp. CJK22405 TaxID=3384615 RepID=UPI003985397E
MITDPFFYLCAIPAVILFGIAKGGFGGTLSLLAVPLLSLAVPPPQAAAIMLPILCTMDLVAVKKYWGQWDINHLRRLLPASVIGITMGALTFSHLPEAGIRILIGATALLFVLQRLTQRWRSSSKSTPSWSATLWGSIAGFTSFGIHAGGPPLSIYLLQQKLSPKIYMGTSSAFFIATNYLKLIPYSLLGQFSTANLETSLALLPIAPLGVLLGYWLLERIQPALFYRIIMIFLFFTGLKLITEGLQQW